MIDRSFFTGKNAPSEGGGAHQGCGLVSCISFQNMAVFALALLVEEQTADFRIVRATRLPIEDGIENLLKSFYLSQGAQP